MRLRIIILLLVALAGAVGALSVERLISTPLQAAPSYVVPDDDGIPATLEESKEWTRQAMFSHIWVLLFKADRPQWEKDWDSMWVVRYKKILQRLELIPSGD